MNECFRAEPTRESVASLLKEKVGCSTPLFKEARQAPDQKQLYCCFPSYH